MAPVNPNIPQGQSAGQVPGQSLQLHDIHIPEQVSNFPVAPGWWILLVLIIIMVIWLFKKFTLKKQLNAVKKQALAVLTNNPTLSAKESISLIKWAAMHYFSRHQLAKLYGEDFQNFLRQQLPEKHQDNFTVLSTAGFEGQYRSTLVEQSSTASEVIIKTNSDCHQAAQLWLTQALPVNKSRGVDKKTTQPLVSLPIKEKELSE